MNLYGNKNRKKKKKGKGQGFRLERVEVKTKPKFVNQDLMSSIMIKINISIFFVKMHFEEKLINLESLIWQELNDEKYF